MIVRTTAKAANLLRAKPAAGIEPDPNDWYLNVVWLDGRKNALLAHAGTAFPIFVPDIKVADLRPLGSWLRSVITESLADEHLPASALGELGIGEPLIAKTASRQVLGFMAQMALLVDWMTAEKGLVGTDFVVLNRRLRRGLHNYDGAYATPLEFTTGRRR
ncbi:MAG TPA: hypothetical protein VGL26_01465 [Jatrophihabitans sp.]